MRLLAFAEAGLDAATWTVGLPGVSGMTRFLLPVLETTGVDGGELATTFASPSFLTFCRFEGGGDCSAIGSTQTKDEQQQVRSVFPCSR